MRSKCVLNLILLEKSYVKSLKKAGTYMPRGKFFPLNASEVNSKGGGWVAVQVNNMLKSMQEQSKHYGTCTLIAFEEDGKTPQKIGENEIKDVDIEKAVKRICTVMQEAVDPERKFDGNLTKIDIYYLYDNIEIRNGIEPGEKDVHCYKIVWSREPGFVLKKRLKEEISGGLAGAVYRAWEITGFPTPESAGNN